MALSVVAEETCHESRGHVPCGARGLRALHDMRHDTVGKTTEHHPPPRAMSTTSLPVRPPPASASGARPVITSDFWDLYKSSKRDTGYVLDWLRRTVENAARTKKSKTPIVPIDGRLTVQNLLQASEFVSKRQVTAPLYIRGAFKRTLVKRRQITEWYRQRERIDPTVKPGNESHAFFNDAYASAFPTMILSHVLILKQTRHSL